MKNIAHYSINLNASFQTELTEIQAETAHDKEAIEYAELSVMINGKLHKADVTILMNMNLIEFETHIEEDKEKVTKQNIA